MPPLPSCAHPGSQECLPSPSVGWKALYIIPFLHGQDVSQISLITEDLQGKEEKKPGPHQGRFESQAPLYTENSQQPGGQNWARTWSQKDWFVSWPCSCPALLFWTEELLQRQGCGSRLGRRGGWGRAWGLLGVSTASHADQDPWSSACVGMPPSSHQFLGCGSSGVPEPVHRFGHGGPIQEE